MNMQRRLNAGILSVFALLAFTKESPAQTWNGTTSTAWGLAGNWSTNSVPGSGNTAIFNNTGNGFVAIDLGGTVRNLLGLQFETSAAAAYTFSNSAGSAFNFDNNGFITINAGTTTAQTINTNIFTNGAFSLTNNGSGGLILAGSITLNTGVAGIMQLDGTGVTTISGNIGNGIAGINKIGNGLLILGGTNTFIGDITSTTTNGTASIRVTSSTALGANKIVTINNAAAAGSSNPYLDLRGGVSIPASVKLVLNGTSNRVALESTGGNNTWNGTIEIQGTPTYAQLYSNTNGDTLTINGSITAPATFTAPAPSTATVTVGQLILRSDLAAASGTAAIVTNGPILMVNGSINKTSPNLTWTINNIGNDWGGGGTNIGTQIASGTLRLGIHDALPTSALLTLGQSNSSGATNIAVFEMNGFNQTVNGIFGAINSTSALGTQNITNDPSKPLSTLTIHTTVADRSYANVEDTSVAASINLISGNVKVVKTGSFKQTLAGRNTYTGGTIVEAGELVLSGAGNYGSSGTFTVNGGILRFSAAQTLTNGVQVTGGNFIIFTPASSAFSGGVQVTNNGTFTLAATGAFSGGVTVDGANALFTTTAANSAYTGGTTLLNGTIRFATTTNLGSTSATLTIHGGMLDANGRNQSVGSLTGTGGVITNTSTTVNSILTVGTGATSGSYAGTITDTFGLNGNTFGKVGITKTSTGTITLAGTHTYTGATLVSGGILQFTTPLPATTPITVNSTGTLSVATSLSGYAGVLTVARNGTFALTNGTPADALGLTGMILGDAAGTAANPNLNLQIGATSDRLGITEAGTVSLNSPTTINITALSGFGAGTYTLISDPAAIGRLMPNGASLPSFVLGNVFGVIGNFGYDLVNSANAIQLQVISIVPTTGTIYWTGAASSSWSSTVAGGNSANFKTDYAGTMAMVGLPNAASNVVISANTPATLVAPTMAMTLDGTYSIVDLTFNNQTNGNTAGTPAPITAISLAPGAISGATLTITPASAANGINVQTGAPASISLTVPVILGAAQTFTVADAGTTLSINGTGSISGAYNLTKAGSGTAVIRLVGTNYTGNTTIAAGTLNLAPTTASSHDGIISGPGNFVKSGTSTLAVNAANTWTGSTTISLGTLIATTIGNGGVPSSIGASTSDASNLVFSGGTLQITATSTSTDRNITMTGSGAIVLPTANSTIDLNGTFIGGGTLVLGGTSATTGGQTSTYNLNGNNINFTGNITINNGALYVNAASELGTGAKTITVPNSTAVLSSIHLVATQGNIDLPAGFSFSTSMGGIVGNEAVSAIFNDAGNNSIAGNFNLLGDTTFQINSGVLALTGTFSNIVAGTRSVIIDGPANHTFTGTLTDGSATALVGFIKGPGAGTVTLDYSATNLGTTKILGGVLRSGRENALANSILQFGDTAAGLTSFTGTLDLATYNQTVASLLVRSNSATANNILIGAGKTLTVNGAFSVGVTPASNGNTTNLTVNGGIASTGSLVINTSTDSVDIGLRIDANEMPDNFATVDLRGLASLSATVAEFRVGSGPGGIDGYQIGATLRLSNTSNTITTTAFRVAETGGGNPTASILYLGAGTNVINADTINIATGKGLGTVRFESQVAGSPGTVVIGGTGSVPLPPLNIGVGTVNTILVTVGSLDLRGHTSTVNVGTLTLGQVNISNSTGGAQGFIHLNSGTFTTETVNMGIKSGASTGATNARGEINVSGTGLFTVANGILFGYQAGAGTAIATLNISGGSFTVLSGGIAMGGMGASTATATVTSVINLSGTGNLTVGGGILMGNQDSSLGKITSTLNITGGTMTMNGDIQRGNETTTNGITATLNLRGGTLDMNGYTIAALNNLNFTGGTLRNAGTINRAVTQTSANGPSTLAVTSTSTSGTTITGAYTLTAGTASIADTKTLTVGSAIIAGGTTLSIGFGSSPLSSGLLTSSATIDLTALTPDNKLNIPLTVSPDLTGPQLFTITVISSGSGGISYNAGSSTLNPAAIHPVPMNFDVVGPYSISGNSNSVTISFTATPVPEAGTIGMLATAGWFLGLFIRRRSFKLSQEALSE